MILPSIKIYNITSAKSKHKKGAYSSLDGQHQNAVYGVKLRRRRIWTHEPWTSSTACGEKSQQKTVKFGSLLYSRMGKTVLPTPQPSSRIDPVDGSDSSGNSVKSQFRSLKNRFWNERPNLFPKETLVVDLAAMIKCHHGKTHSLLKVALFMGPL